MQKKRTNEKKGVKFKEKTEKTDGGPFPKIVTGQAPGRILSKMRRSYYFC